MWWRKKKELTPYREPAPMGPEARHISMIEEMGASVNRDHHDFDIWVIKSLALSQGVSAHIEERNKDLSLAISRAYDKYSKFLKAYE